jgi:CheY-like chemotaxis protein
MSPKILIVEDEPSIAENIVYALETDGFAVTAVTTGREALEMASQQEFQQRQLAGAQQQQQAQKNFADQQAKVFEAQQKAAAAQREGRLAEEIVPVSIPQRKGEAVLVSEDEFLRPETSMQTLAKLKPAFRHDGNAGFAKAVTVKLRDITAVEIQAAGAHAVNTGNGIDQRGLAGTVGADHADQFASLHLQGHIPQSGGGAVVDGNVADFKHGAFPGKR